MKYFDISNNLFNGLSTPTGTFYNDEDDYSEIIDKEIILHGFIYKEANILVNFRLVNAPKELATMRQKAEKLAKNEKG
ncbi:MAG: hypothetical protein ACI308_01020 [Muribaculaceae bacterium]